MKVKGMVFVCILYHLWGFMPFNLDCQYHAKLGLCPDSWAIQVLGKGKGMGTLPLGSELLALAGECAGPAQVWGPGSAHLPGCVEEGPVACLACVGTEVGWPPGPRLQGPRGPHGSTRCG